jgi:tRNA(Arg) A34 adenosine deaminase TadA
MPETNDSSPSNKPPGLPDLPLEDLTRLAKNTSNDPENVGAFNAALRKLPEDKVELIQGVLNRLTEVPSDRTENKDFMEKWKVQFLKAAEMYCTAKQFSVQENMAIAVAEGLQSILYGNFAVGSVLEAVVAGADGNYVFTFAGRNQARSLEDPSGHAEINVIRKFQRRGTARQGIIEDTLTRKERAPYGYKPRVRLFTTLDPCFGCARNIFSAGIDEVIIGAEDPNAGVLLGAGRQAIESIPHAGKWLASHTVSRINYTDPSSEYYVDPKYRSLLEEYLPEQSTFARPLDLSSLVKEYETTPSGPVSKQIGQLINFPKIWEIK